MIPKAFAYERAHSVAEAVDLLQQAGGAAKLLAGGHSLLPLMKLRLSAPAKLIDISRLDELRGVSVVGERLFVGALTTHHQVATHPLVCQHLPVLAEAAAQIGDPQVRNRGTVGGNLAHADAASDLPAVALALEAQLHVQSPAGDEVFAAEDFFLGPLVTALPEYGVLRAVSFALPPSGARSCYSKFPHPASGYAVVGVAAVVAVGARGTVEFARVAVTGAADVPYRARAVEAVLLGQPPQPEVLRAAAGHAADDGAIAGDAFASEAYRRHLCAVMTERALRRACGLADAAAGA
ncbi:MAG: xanthine dehydrogenase family protein subunit M [Alicyclobacillus sp.]|nr:xanthine dehydrogenase family protein subunit M [Alicyclobacillus sp.]